MSFVSRPVRYRHDDALTRISRDEFERLIADHYRKQGYVVACASVVPGDNRGQSVVDLTLRRGGETILVASRHWVAQQVPSDELHRLMGAMPASGATGAIVITSGEFTLDAIDAAARFRHVKLIDGMAIRAMLGHVREPEAVWTSIDTLPSAFDHAIEHARTTTASVIAAVGAVVVMGALLVALYTFYVGEIHQAQMDAMAQKAPPIGVAANDGMIASRTTPSAAKSANEWPPDP